ncbi:MAG: hypothetical protein HY036_06465 [Nitrospirae bacterium]|nr:hypothetical protein [Nitrospirota bacterium]
MIRKKKMMRFVLLLSALGMTHCGQIDVVAANRFGTAPMGSGAIEGLYTSLAVDQSGQAHISFYDSTNGALKYTWFDSSRRVWNDEFVDLGGVAGVGIDNSLALDPVTGSPRISYYDQTNHRLLFASWTGTQWFLEVVDPGFGHDVGQFSSLVLDASGRPAVAYYDATQGSLKLAESAATGPPFNFSSGTIDSGNVGQYCSLALDPITQEYRIAYYDAGHQDNKVAAWDNTTSNFYTFFVDPAIGTGIFNSVAVDRATGKIHLAYYDMALHVLKYAKSSFPPFTTPPVWTIEVADPGNGHDVGQFAALTLDAGGNPYIAYYDATLFTLKLGQRSNLGWSLSWPIYFGSSSPDAGLYPSIKVNPVNGAVYISFYDQTAGQLGFFPQL